MSRRKDRSRSGDEHTGPVLEGEDVLPVKPLELVPPFIDGVDAPADEIREPVMPFTGDEDGGGSDPEPEPKPSKGGGGE